MNGSIFKESEEVISWLKSRRRKNFFSVEQVPFDKSDQWHFEENSGNLAHASGKFFRIIGIHAETNFGPIEEWEQPIILQPEIGILGVITKKVDSIRYFLFQAKMEPGNVNIVQLSPTVQATKSNYTQVHKGKLPPYLDYFLNRRKSRFLIDTLQSEQGGRFLRKRNRNMIVEVEEEIEVLDDFCWLTSCQIKELMGRDNLINMDARTVLSCIAYADGGLDNHIGIRKQIISDRMVEGFSGELLKSMAADHQAVNSINTIISWFVEIKTKFELSVKEIPLGKINDWCRTETEIKNIYEDHFSVIMVSVRAGNREVSAWDQPLFKSSSLGLIGFIAKTINGILHFLVQAKVEPGNLDIVEMAPTVCCSNYKRRYKKSNKPAFLDDFVNAAPDQIKYDTIQSEEGGRFYHFQNRCMVIKLKPSDEIIIPDNYFWMTFGQMLELTKHGYFNVEARCLIACITP
jgi:dTDP-4-dehydro-6-deoxy-alpha-D-glucopyranose 2,3-dehydratase